jgi:mannitol-1-/sugar-/sorbitol-6-phosphatase
VSGTDAPRAFRVSGLLLDLDGTLVDSTAVVDRRWGLFADRLGLERSAVVGRFHGMPASDTLRRIAPQLSEREVEALAEEFHAAEIEDADLVEALPGAHALLHQLPPDRWAIVTSCPHALALARLEGAGLPVPRVLVTADGERPGKPDPAPYLFGAQSLGLAPADCLAVEDAPLGIRSATDAGCRLLGVRTTLAQLPVPSVADLTQIEVTVDGAALDVRLHGEVTP